MKMTLRWGIASAGKISHDFVCAIQIHPPQNHKIIAIAARSLSDATEFAETHNIPQAYEGYEALGKNKEIDIVYIGSINPQHLPIAKVMLDYGKHVLCEKPLTMNSKDTKELLEYAKKKKLFLMEGVWSRCFPAYNMMHELLKDGIIGEILQVTVDFGFALQHVERVNVNELGGSATLDIGIYMLQFAQYIFRGMKPISIVSSGHLNKFGTDDSSSVIIMYPGGRTAVLTCNARVELSNSARVYGTKGILQIPTFWCPTNLLSPEESYTFELLESNAKYNFTNSAGLAYEVDEVRHCIKKGLLESPKMPHAESLELAEQMDILRKNCGINLP